MPILRGCDVFVLAAMRIHVIRDTFRDGIATGYTQFAAFAKCRLHIHNDQSFLHVCSLPNLPAHQNNLIVTLPRDLFHLRLRTTRWDSRGYRRSV